MSNDKSTVSNALVPAPSHPYLENTDLKDAEGLLAEMKSVRAVEGRNPDGTFAPGNNASIGGRHSLAKKVAALVRTKLAELDPTDTEGRAKLERIIDNLVTIATNTNPKNMKEAIWAFNSLMERAFGAPLKSDEELEAIANSGSVRVVVVSSQLPTRSLQREIPKPAAFVDAEVIE